jgi:DNA-binding transcriptional ArsR family regulator
MPYRAQPVHVAKATLFRSLGHPARVRILELLREGEQPVGALQDALGLESAGTSQHLAALRRASLVVTRREGSSVFYRVADPEVFVLLEAGRTIVRHALEDQRALLEEISAE